MVPHSTTILPRVTGEWARLLPPAAILTRCREIGSTAWRDRVRTPVTTGQLFLWQMRHGHTACRHLPHRSGLRLSAAAYGHARAKLPLRFDRRRERFGSAVPRAAVDEGRWPGHRTCLVDGSGCAMPESPDPPGRSASQPSRGRGAAFPWRDCWGCSCGHRCALTRVVAPLLTHELARVQAVHPS